MTYSPDNASSLVMVLFAWPLVVLALFAFLPARRAVVWSFLIGLLFLPEGAYVIVGFPEYSKHVATSFGVLLASILFDGGRPFRTRPRWPDLGMLVWCTSRIATSVSNGLGVYDGLASTFDQIVDWGLPYWIGRTYFSDREGIRELARGIVVGGLLYLPPCLWELRLSPQLHLEVYGFRPAPFLMSLRYGGYRPTVFLQSSLMVAMWMGIATVVCAWLAASKSVPVIAGLRTSTWVWPLAITTLLCKAVGAITLMGAGLILLYAARSLRLAFPLGVLLAMFGSYPALRALEILDNPRILSVASVLYDEVRLRSLGVRTRSEDMYLDHARERPLLGWGGWDRGDVVVDGIRSVPDGLWVIALSRAGWIALAALLWIYLLPPLLLMTRYPARRWLTPELAPSASIAIVLALYWVDCLSNAMVNLVLLLALGAAAGRFARRIPEGPTSEPPPRPEALREPRAPSLARGLSARKSRRQEPAGGRLD